MKKRPDLTKLTRQRFIDAFSEIYMQKPVERMTVKEIAERAGYNRVTFYQYFRDAYDILEHMEVELLDYIKKKITENIYRDDMFEKFISIFENIFVAKPALSRTLLTGANCAGTLEKCKAVMMPVILESFAIEAQDYRSRAVFEFYLSGIVSLLKYKAECGEKLTAEQIGSIIKIILRDGVMPQLKL